MESLQNRKGFLPGLFGHAGERTSSRATSSDEKMKPKPLPFIQRIPSGPRNHFIAMTAEFVGTFMFLFFAFAGTQVANTSLSAAESSTAPNPQVLMYISLSFAFSLAVNAWIFYRVSGGLFNPAVTLGLCLVGAVPFSRGALIFLAQMLGAMASAGICKALFPGPLAVTTTLGGGTSIAQGCFIEMFLTAILVFTILMLAVEKHKSTFLAPVGIGLALFIAELGGVYYTGGSLNPARSFGPCVANRSFPGYHWIYWIGPCLGAVLAAGFYWFIKAVEYQTTNPGQDFDDLEANAFDPSVDLSRPVVHPNAVVDRSDTQDLALLNSGEVRGSMSPNRARGSSTNEKRGSGMNEYSQGAGTNNYPQVGTNDYPQVGTNEYSHSGMHEYPQGSGMNQYTHGDGTHEYPREGRISERPQDVTRSGPPPRTVTITSGRRAY